LVRKPLFDFRGHSCHSAPMEMHAYDFRLSANVSEGQKRSSIIERLGELSRRAVNTNLLPHDESHAFMARDWPGRPSLLGLQDVIFAEKV
jgi:hypothetical protein